MAAETLPGRYDFTPPDGSVLVSLEVEGQAATLSVEDQGSGIPNTERELVLNRFYRGRNRSPTGSGLGLPIAISALERAEAKLCLDRSPGLGGFRASVVFEHRRVRPESTPKLVNGLLRADLSSVGSLA